jgi:hypothetical protein
VVVEALNSRDSPRAALVSSRRALEVINLVRVGCEYKPSDPADSSTSFGWRQPDEV